MMMKNGGSLLLLLPSPFLQNPFFTTIAIAIAIIFIFIFIENRRSYLPFPSLCPMAMATKSPGCNNNDERKRREQIDVQNEEELGEQNTVDASRGNCNDNHHDHIQQGFCYDAALSISLHPPPLAHSALHHAPA
jgi:hypothetical protein